LVTGAAGFIGSNLTERLLKQGHKVIGIDIDTKKRDNLKIPETMHVIKNGVNFVSKKFTMIWDDINSIERYSEYLNDIDIVYHLAASADIRRSFTEPTLDLHNNVNGTSAVLELIRKKGIKKLVFSSSSAVYGISPVVPTPEDMPNLRPISLYGSSKLANEAFIYAYSDLYGIKAWMFRFANVVGKNEHRGVIFDLVKKLNANQKTLEILGDGNQEKSFFDVSDCVDGLIEIPKRDKNKSVEVYNLGNTKTVKIKKLAEIVCDEIGVNPKFKFTGGDRGWPGDAPFTILSIKKALKTNWKLNYDVEESIRRTVRWMFEIK
jgi:UDP-glucose 4-epimerase